MKSLTLMFFLWSFSLSIGAQTSWADTLWSAIEDLHEAQLIITAETDALFQEGAYGVSVKDSIKGVGIDTISPRNSVLLSNYYQDSTDSLLANRSFGSIPMQSTIQFRRLQTVAGIDFILGAQGFLNDGRLDNSRSGIIFEFDHNTFLRKISDKQANWISQKKTELKERQLALNPKLLAANTEVLFDEYLNTLNSQEYRECQASLQRRMDSLQQVKTTELTTHQSELLERAKLFQQLETNYHQLLTRIKKYPHQLHGAARGIIDSFQTAFGQIPEMDIEQQLMSHPEITALQKILIRTKTFNLGNTRLPSDDFISAGLPIKGLNYAYDGPVFGFSLQHGKRVASSHFIPRDGVPYHDIDNNFRLSQVTVRFGDLEKSNYQISTLLASEAKIKGGGPQLTFPRNNQVFTFTGNTTIGKHFAFTTSASRASTRLDIWGSSLPGGDLPTGQEQEALGDLALRAGATYSGETIDLAVILFRTGANFRSFANPYLYTDYEGAEINLSAGLFDNRLFGKFSLALGGGTTETTQNNIRWRAQGFLRYQVNKRGMLSLLVSPNVYRYQVTGQESFTESSIYQLNYQQSISLGSRDLVVSAGITNLDQGWSWADSTQVAQAIILRGTTQMALTKKISIAFDGGYRLPGKTTNELGASGEEWYATFSPALSGKFHFAASLRRDKYRFENLPAWGGNLDWQLPVGKLGTLSINLFYRPARATPDGESTARQFLSQQHLFANF